MAGYKYFTVLTDVGKQKLVEAIANETALDFTEMAVGDSNGTSYDPTPDMTALKHETYRATISSVSIDEVDRNIMIFLLVVPSSSGGYYIREAGLFSSDGSLIAIARTAEQYKPQLSEGAGANIDINMRIAISSEAQIYINVPESDSYATQNYVKEEFKKHTQKEDPHQQYMLETYANEIFAIKEHNHELSSLNGVLPIGKGGTGTDNGFNFQNFFTYTEIGTPNATLQEFWNNLPLNISGCTYIPYGTVADLIDKFGILFFIKAVNRRYLKFLQFSTNFGTYDEYILIDDASKSDITFNDFIHTTANGFPKKAYPLSGIRRYSSEFSTEEEIYNLNMNIGDVLSVNNLSSHELLWRYKTRRNIRKV